VGAKLITVMNKTWWKVASW